MGDIYGQRIISPESQGLITLDNVINHVFGSTPTLLVRPSEVERGLYLSAEVGGWRIKPGDHIGRTFTAAVTDILTASSHGWETGDGPLFASSSGTLPAGMDASTGYYIVDIDGDDFNIVLSSADARSNSPTPVDITDTGTGTHTLGQTPPALVVSGAETNGDGSHRIAENDSFAMTAPKKITVVGYGGSDVLTYFWV